MKRNPDVTIGDTTWVGAARCEQCGYLTAAEFTGGPDAASYREEFPVECTLAFVRQDLRHPACGGAHIKLGSELLVFTDVLVAALHSAEPMESMR